MKNNPLIAICLMFLAGSVILAQNGRGKDQIFPVIPEDYGEAPTLFKEIEGLHSLFKFDEARNKMKSLVTRYPDVQKMRPYRMMVSDLNIIGKQAGDLKVKTWFQGETDLESFPVTLLVWWEAWCPHCQDELPKLEQVYRKQKDRGLNIIGVTRVMDSSNTAVFAFIGERDITFPILKEPGEMATHYGVDGVPAAAIVKGGTIIWRGKPSAISEETLEIALKDVAPE